MESELSPPTVARARSKASEARGSRRRSARSRLLADLGDHTAVLGALVQLVWYHKLWWMAPLLVALLVLGALLFVQSTPAGPLIYPVF